VKCGAIPRFSPKTSLFGTDLHHHDRFLTNG
jgi:hypothetical protein